MRIKFVLVADMQVSKELDNPRDKKHQSVADEVQSLSLPSSARLSALRSLHSAGGLKVRSSRRFSVLNANKMSLVSRLNEQLDKKSKMKKLKN